MYDLLVLGSGVAGLTTALHAARRGCSVIVLTKGELSHSATRYAQGGVAAALAAPDAPDLHLADTLTAGAGLCDIDATRVMVTEGPDRVRELAGLGARFDSDPGADVPALAREGGHSLARVVHAGGDATGAEIERALVEAVRASSVEVREGWFATDLLGGSDRVTGARALGPGGATDSVSARHVVLATGGAGQCFAVTTNPTLSTGDGIALALRVGAACADVEFVQFHPTALHHLVTPRPLISEALRGEGAVLRDLAGVTFMGGEHPLADLAPRDIVSRAIFRIMGATGADHVWLDATMIDDFPRRFPTIWAACATAGLDPRRDWIPVAPAAHYMSGGAVTDLDGATTVPGLWACGETACSGVHGANRLASNSLLDGLVFGRRVVEAIVAGKESAEPTGAMTGVSGAAAAGPAPVSVVTTGTGGDAAGLRAEVQRIMGRGCGVLRDGTTLQATATALTALAAGIARLPADDVAAREVDNLCLVARAIVASALARTESRGAHWRTDHPSADDALRGRFVVAGEAPVFVPLPERATAAGEVAR